MKSNTARTEALDTIAETAMMLSNFAALVLADITAARGEPEQERHTRPRLSDKGDPETFTADELVERIREREAERAGRPLHSDSTGERAIKNDPASRDLAEIDKRLTRARTDMAVIVRIFQRHQAARTPEQIKDVRVVAERELDSVGDDWCRSHLRVAEIEPIEVRKNGDHAGKPYYKGMCRDCGSLLADLKNAYPKRFRTYQLPPVELVGIRTYRKLRQSDIDALVGPQHRKRKVVKVRPGDDRKRRSA